MIKKIFTALSLVVSALILGGCNSGENYENFLTFHVAEQKSSVGVSRSKVTMPQSGFEVIANDSFAFSHAHLDKVQVAEVKTFDGLQTIRGLLFSLTQDGSKILYRETATNRNGWILLKERHDPVGLRKIDTIISDGSLFMIVEFPPDVDLQEKADDYNEGIRIIQKKISKKNNSIFSTW